MLGAVLFLLFFPFEMTVAPDWNIHVIDENGGPLPGAIVMEDWEQYSLERQSHEEEKFTGPDGSVHFPERTLRATFASRFAGCLANFRELGAHASCGPHPHLVGRKCGYGWMLSDIGKTKGDTWSGGSHRASATIFLRACPNGGDGIECMPFENGLGTPCVNALWK